MLSTTLAATAVTTVKKPLPRVDDEDILIKLHNRFYYIDEYNLHCYNTQRGEDTDLEHLGIKDRIKSIWYDKDSDCLYFLFDEGGMKIASETLFRVSNDNKLTSMVTLTGDLDEVTTEVTEDYVYLKGFVDEYFAVNIPGIKTGQPFEGFYTTTMKPWTLTKHSLETLKKPEMIFYSITAPGVNVRTYGDSKAPRLGYFKPRPGAEEEGYWLMSENSEIDPQVHTRSFTPWHPEMGDIFAAYKNSYTNEGWTSIIVDDIMTEASVSSKFVKQIENEPLVSLEQFPDGELKDRVYKMTSAKYPGVWLMIGELPYCGEAPLYVGKEIDGLVVFKWIAGWPVYSGNSGERVYIDECKVIFYGKELLKNDYDLDLSKINDSDLDTLFKVAKPLFSQYPVLVKIPDYGVKVFDYSDRHF